MLAMDDMQNAFLLPLSEVAYDQFLDGFENRLVK
jgi:hypothetical protein